MAALKNTFNCVWACTIFAVVLVRTTAFAFLRRAKCRRRTVQRGQQRGFAVCVDLKCLRFNLITKCVCVPGNE